MIYDRMGIVFEKCGEPDHSQLLSPMVNKLISEGIATENGDGSIEITINVNKKNYPFAIRNSSGRFTNGANDMAALNHGVN